MKARLETSARFRTDGENGSVRDTYRVERDAKFGRHQHNSHDLVEPAETTSVDLDVIERLGLQELLEHDAVLAVFAGGDLDVVFLEGGADGGVAEDVVGGGGFFDEERFERGEVGEVSFRFGDGPDL